MRINKYVNHGTVAFQQTSNMNSSTLKNSDVFVQFELGEKPKNFHKKSIKFVPLIRLHVDVV